MSDDTSMQSDDDERGSRSVDGTERCEECGEGPVGVTMWPEMEGWSCPFCGHYNEVTHEVER